MNEELDEIKKGIVNNEFDYSNIIVTSSLVAHLVKYLDQIYNNFQELIQEDEEKNKRFKPEYKEYKYKKMYRDDLEIAIYSKLYNNHIMCNDYETFKSAIDDGNLNNVRKLDINLYLNFKRGKGNDLDEHKNEFIISFEPYDIRFIRKSNHNDANMNKLEEQINAILSNFPTANTIFCNKENK